jgi:PAS domain S-box-containing protein
VQSDKGVVVTEVAAAPLDSIIEPGDFLVDINGFRVRSLDDYAQITEVLVENHDSGILADYTFRRPGSGEEVTVPVRLEARSQIGAPDFPLILVAFSFLVIGVLTFMKNSRTPGAFHFALLSLVAFALLMFRYSGRADGLDVAVYWLSAGAFLLLPPMVLHFCLYFPEPQNTLERFSHRKAILYAPALLLGVVHTAWFLGQLRFVGWGRSARSGLLLDKLELAHFIIYLALASYAIITAHRSTTRPIQRKQMQWIASGCVLGILPFTVLYAIPYLLDLRIAGWMEFSIISLCLIPLSFGYAIAKFRLKDVDLIFKRGVAYVVASSTLFAFYVGIALLIGRAVQDFSPESGFYLLAVSALGVAFLFAPLRDRIQEQLDRYFYRDRYGYRQSFLDFGKSLGSEIQLGNLTEQVSNRIYQTLDVTSVAVFLRDDRNPGTFRLQTLVGHDAPDGPSSLEASEDALFSLAAEGSSAEVGLSGEWLTPERETLYRWGFRYGEPLFVRGRLIGFLALGRRRGGDFLSSEDLDMVSGLAGYASIAIDNALLYRSLEKKANELLELQIYSENVIESISLGVAVISDTGTVTVWNNAMSAVTGISREAAIDRPISEVLPPNLQEVLSEIVDGPDWLVKEARQVYKAHLEFDDDNRRLLNITLAPFISHEDINTGTLLIFNDITDRVRLENQLQQAERLSSIGLFAAGIAHEVNTPLAAISSYAQMLLGDARKDDPQRELLEKIEKQSFRASDILNNLLNFARFSDRDFEELNLNSLMLDTLSLLEHHFRKSAIEIDLDFEPTLPATIGNAGKLQQVFMNLFLNARDSMPKGGRLRLSTRKVNSELVVQVEDSGTGISKDAIKRIYDPFFTTKPVGRGTGLGLSISYGIIQEHSGRIKVDSQPGKGTTFSVYIPVKRVN